ncbi:polysaccharide deacetylase family protein [Streptomyces xanthophaeus]|uniref:polysaccharide deacetylase family protein n=1 Tax=Streptomyces xanthophaeus TaxID=67385 RepID=UPI0026477F4B|nr:polysaccharide deacetylase family protein [Streptomyces xanthophaeus]
MERRSALAGLLCAGFAGFAGLAGFGPSSPAVAAPAPAWGRTARAASGPRPPASLLGDEIRRLPTSRKVLALTFNAAWDVDGIDTVLAELRRRKLPATFFPTGTFAETHPAAVRSIADAGHGLGNHSYSHPYFDDLSTTERADEVRGADAAIRAASGTEPLPFFRFPYSSTTPESITDVNDLGYAAIEFSADTNGYLGPQGGMSVDKAVERAVDAFVPGAIIQMHVGSNGSGVVLDAEALPLIVDAALAEGYEVIDLRQFLEAAAGVR